MTARALRLGAALALLALGACSEAFDPRVPSDQAFAVYGTLDGREAVQRLRVQDLALPVDGTPERLPAVVTSVERVSGESATWADSLVRLTDGGLDHLFTAPLTPRPGDVFALRVERTTDGAVSTAEVALPVPRLALSQLGRELSGRLDVLGLPAPPPDVVVRYRARPRGGDGVVETVSAYGVSEAGAVLLVFGEDARQLLNRFVPGTAVELLSATLEGVARSAAPAPVEGGVGEIGWVVPFAVPVPLRTEDVEAAGLLDAR